MQGSGVRVSSPSVLPLMLHASRDFQAALGLTLEQPRIRIRGGRIESQGVPGLLGDELTLLSSMVSSLLGARRVVAVYDAARFAELKGWRGSLAAAGFSYGGILMVAGRPGSLQPVISRFHIPADTRVVVADLPCRAGRRTGLKGMMELLAHLASKNYEGFLEFLAGIGRSSLKRCGVLSHLIEELGGKAAVGASPTGLLYIVGRNMDMCRLGELLLDLGLSSSSIITGPQNYGARVEVEAG
jgi:hypothetical protein